MKAGWPMLWWRRKRKEMEETRAIATTAIRQLAELRDKVVDLTDATLAAAGQQAAQQRRQPDSES